MIITRSVGNTHYLGDDIQATVSNDNILPKPIISEDGGFDLFQARSRDFVTSTDFIQGPAFDEVIPVLVFFGFGNVHFLC